jgi:hydrogenase nickel incorporation protein HypA/HybF
MHELGLCSSIVEAVERRAGERPVRSVRVRVGRLHHVHPEAFDQSFALAAAGTVAAGAAAELVFLPVRSHCRSCGSTTESELVLTGCPDCSSVDLDLVGGDELVLESLEYQP